jgi:hypothetical protein
MISRRVDQSTSSRPWSSRWRKSANWPITKRSSARWASSCVAPGARDAPVGGRQGRGGYVTLFRLPRFDAGALPPRAGRVGGILLPSRSCAAWARGARGSSPGVFAALLLRNEPVRNELGGRKGIPPWHLRRFVSLTLGHPLPGTRPRPRRPEQARRPFGAAAWAAGAVRFLAASPGGWLGHGAPEDRFS